MKKFKNIAMLAAGIAGLAPSVPSAEASAPQAQVSQQASRAESKKSAAIPVRSGQSAQQALRFAGEGLYGGLFVEPFAPWRAPLYNQRKARKAARQMGRKVRRS